MNHEARLRRLERYQPADPSGPDLTQVDDPLELARVGWPDVTFFGKQLEIIEAVRDCDEVYVHAANQVGKDYVAAFIALAFFLTKGPTVRVITTSVKDDHLR